MIEGISKDVEPGQIFLGKVMRITSFGAFVEFLPGKKGLFIYLNLTKAGLSGLKMCKCGRRNTSKSFRY